MESRSLRGGYPSFPSFPPLSADCRGKIKKKVCWTLVMDMFLLGSMLRWKSNCNLEGFSIQTERRANIQRDFVGSISKIIPGNLADKAPEMWLSTCMYLSRKPPAQLAYLRFGNGCKLPRAHSKPHQVVSSRVALRWEVCPDERRSAASPNLLGR